MRRLRRSAGAAVVGALTLVTAACGDATAPVPGLGPGGAGGAGGASGAGGAGVGAGASGEGAPGRAILTDPAVLADPAAYAARLVTGTNLARADAGLPALAESGCARDAAAPRAAALVGTPDLEHAPLDGVLAACAPRTVAAENLSRAAADPERVVDAWMGSVGHRENLLSPTLTEIGVGCVSDGAAMLCSQVFLGP